MLAHEIPSIVLRPFQREALQALRHPNHVICIAPTGAGKSLIYERFAKDHRVLLITPLIALARQQHARLLAKGVSATLAAGPDPSPPPNTQSGVWILSPERLASPQTVARLKEWKPHLMTIDECHCIWDWGESFRPAFQRIPKILRELKIPRSLWLTATLPPNAREALKKSLDGDPIEIGEFALPPTLQLEVRRVPLPERPGQILRFVMEQSEPGIIFVQTRSAAERLALLLKGYGKLCAVYHAGMANEERRITERKIEEREPDIVVATSAFGMGMDHPHLRWALLSQLPPSLLALAQSIGRAGRNPNHPSQALLFWDPDDFQLLKWMTQGSERRLRDLLDVKECVHHEGCRTHSLERYFAVRKRNALSRCNRCDFCLTLPRSANC